MSVATSVRSCARPLAPTGLQFAPYKLGPLTLPHRIVMAPLTPSGGQQPGNVPATLNTSCSAQCALAASGCWV